MNILYGIQGTGHGHISRARELLPVLRKYADVDVIMSGYNSKLDPNQSITYRKQGISLTYDSKGGVSVLETLRNVQPIRFINDVRSIPLDEYDLVISDYEPVSAWSAKLQDVPCVALSHQAAFLSMGTPRPNRKSFAAETLLQYFAPARHPIGFHFRRYDDFIESPVIRSSVRKLSVSRSNHLVVYLPAFHHDMLKQIFAPFAHVDWHIFAPSCSQPIQDSNIWIRPVGNECFLDSLAGCRGVICNAGFEMCAEAMYLDKKLLAVPIRNQYEQECNAAALRKLGVLTLSSLDDKFEQICHWLDDPEVVSLNHIADPEKVVRRVLEIYSTESGNRQTVSHSFLKAVS